MLVRRNTELISFDTWVVDADHKRNRDLNMSLMEIGEFLKTVPNLKEKHFRIFDYFDSDWVGLEQKEAHELADAFTQLTDENNDKLSELALEAASQLQSINDNEELRSNQVYKEYDTVSVAFTIYTEDDDPNLVSLSCGIQPSLIRKKGDNYQIVEGVKGKELRSAARHSLWEIKSDLPKVALIEDHIKCLLEICEPYKTQLLVAANKYGMRLSVGAYSYWYNTQCYFDAKLLAAISEYGADLWLDFYHADNEDDWIV